MRGATLIALACAAALAAAAAGPAEACACGIALEATIDGERALVIERPGEEEIIASFDLTADERGTPAVVLPVPGDPEVEAIEHGDPLAYLDEATTVPEPQATGGAEGAVGAAPGRGVDVLGRETIGGYDVSRLRANDPAALDAWLHDNGYAVPGGAEEIFAAYVEQGWRYVAVRLAPDTDGRLKPLRVRFATDRVVYPMRLTQLGEDGVNLTLYVLAGGPREAELLESTYEGPVAELDPPVPTELRDLLGAAPYLTKLEAIALDPALFTDDLRIASPGATAARTASDELAWLAAVAAVALVGGLTVLVRARLR